MGPASVDGSIKNLMEAQKGIERHFSNEPLILWKLCQEFRARKAFGMPVIEDHGMAVVKSNGTAWYLTARQVSQRDKMHIVFFPGCLCVPGLVLSRNDFEKKISMFCRKNSDGRLLLEILHML